MTILITGANGQLGMSLRDVISADRANPGTRANPGSFIFTDVAEAPGVATEKLDITDLEAVRRMVQERGVDAIVNCAAYTNVDKAESDRELAELLNATAPENLAKAMKEAGGLLVHISTDYVFGGEAYNTPCNESRTGTPTGVYGLTKLHGEQAVQRVGCRHVIIRTAWLYSEYGKNFVKTVLALTATKPQLKVVFDQVGTPTYAHDLAEAIVAVLAAAVPKAGSAAAPQAAPRLTGIYHFSNEGACSWYDFAKMIAEYSGQTACDIRPCHSDEFPSPVRRPAYSVLDKTKFKNTFGRTIPYWTESLKTCIANLKKQ